MDGLCIHIILGKERGPGQYTVYDQEVVIDVLWFIG